MANKEPDIMRAIQRPLRSFAVAVMAITLAANWFMSGAESQTNDPVTLGVQALDANKVDEAIDIFEKAIAADPNNPEALARLGSAQVRKARTVNIFSAPGWVNKGFNTLDQAVERFPDAFVVYFVRGITATNVPDMFRKAEVAVKDLSAVVAMREKNPDAVPERLLPSVYLNLGRAYKKTGQATEARAAWEKGKQLYPSAPETPAIEKELQEL
jgi:tetratricopeptide (TPR) repeat protein